VLGSVGENLDVNFVMKEIPADRQFAIWWIILGQWDSLTDKKRQHKCRVLTEEKLDDIGARLEHAPRKSLKCLSWEAGVSKSSAKRSTQLLKLRPYKTRVMHALQPRDPASRVHFCVWFLQSVVKGKINLQLTFFLMKHGFTCRDTLICKIIATGVHRIHI
jgi:hypothetical protein